MYEGNIGLIDGLRKKSLHAKDIVVDQGGEGSSLQRKKEDKSIRTIERNA